MPFSDPATAEQVKIMAQQAASIALGEVAPQIGQLERAIARLNGAVPEDGEKTIPGVLKWLAGIAACVLGFIITASLAWVATSMGEMKETIARMDERLKAQTTAQDGRFADYDRRISQLERFHQMEGGGS